MMSSAAYPVSFDEGVIDVHQRVIRRQEVGDRDAQPGAGDGPDQGPRQVGRREPLADGLRRTVEIGRGQPTAGNRQHR